MTVLDIFEKKKWNVFFIYRLVTILTDLSFLIFTAGSLKIMFSSF